MNGFYMNIPVGMLFRRFYCGNCGTRLKRIGEKKVLVRGDEGFDEAERYLRRPVQGGKIRIYTNPMEEITVKEYRYICPGCNRVTMYDEQKEVAKQQKQLKRKVIEE